MVEFSLRVREVTSSILVVALFAIGLNKTLKFIKMNTSNTWFKKLASDDTIDFLPTILIVILVSCILFCILWMIISLVRKRSHVQQLNTHREAAVAAFFDTENLRVLDSVYTSSGDPLGKLSSYQPVLYFIKIEPFDLNRKICKVHLFFLVLANLCRGPC